MRDSGIPSNSDRFSVHESLLDYEYPGRTNQLAEYLNSHLIPPASDNRAYVFRYSKSNEVGSPASVAQVAQEEGLDVGPDGRRDGMSHRRVHLQCRPGQFLGVDGLRELPT